MAFGFLHPTINVGMYFCMEAVTASHGATLASRTGMCAWCHGYLLGIMGIKIMSWISA